MASVAINYSGIVARAGHATPTTVIMRTAVSPQHSANIYPIVANVRTGIVYGPGQYDQKEYLTGTMAGTKILPFLG
jgi:hypothetical protein